MVVEVVIVVVVLIQIVLYLQVLVRGAGHDVFEQQRERVFDLLHRFINDIPFS